MKMSSTAFRAIENAIRPLVTYRTALGEVRTGELVVRYGTTYYVRDSLTQELTAVPGERLGH